MIKILYAYLILNLLNISCAKTKKMVSLNDLPPATQKGLNTFGCLVNGKGFINQGFGPNFRMSYVRYMYSGFDLEVSDNANSPFKSLIIGGNNISFHTGGKYQFASYSFDMNNSFGANYLTDSVIGSNSFIDFNYYTRPPMTSGELDLSLVDTVNRIISGTFNFTAIDPNSNRLVTISEGRFDGKYNN